MLYYPYGNSIQSSINHDCYPCWNQHSYFSLGFLTGFEISLRCVEPVKGNEKTFKGIGHCSTLPSISRRRA